MKNKQMYNQCDQRKFPPALLISKYCEKCFFYKKEKAIYQRNNESCVLYKERISLLKKAHQRLNKRVIRYLNAAYPNGEIRDYFGEEKSLLLKKCMNCTGLEPILFNLFNNPQNKKMALRENVELDKALIRKRSITHDETSDIYTSTQEKRVKKYCKESKI